jgi:hypothetical protein
MRRRPPRQRGWCAVSRSFNVPVRDKRRAKAKALQVVVLLMEVPVDRVVVPASPAPAERAVVRIRPEVVPVDRVVVPASRGVPVCRACYRRRRRAERRMGVVPVDRAVQASAMNRVA